MNVLIVDKCLYTRIGISCFFSEAPAINIHHVNSVIDASEQNDMPNPDVILVNLTDYCRINGQDSTLLHFFTQFSSAKIFIYIDTEYPNSARPVILDSHVYIINKQNLIPLLAPCQTFTLSLTCKKRYSNILAITLCSLNENPLSSNIGWRKCLTIKLHVDSIYAVAQFMFTSNILPKRCMLEIVLSFAISITLSSMLFFQHQQE